ncbi:MAG: aldehyde ferredoxin oxidoreductase family protein [Thaumarchaeota archaeon]|nr:aldehyde ferredoxin oxidoreductase family protein [Nitrososphaerota archaeon]
MNGYAGKILHINLSNNDVWDEELKETYARDYIGGRGLGARILWDEVGPNIDPLSPDNKTIFVTGPLTGTGVTTSNKYVMVTKSPLTGIYMFSNAGGGMGIALKNAGFDTIVVEGKASAPSYISVDQGKTSIHDAEHLWGKGVFETTVKLKETHGKDAMASMIGPAGENLVKYAAVITEDKRSFGRCGGGAVMGSKNLKAVVAKSKPAMRVADRQGFANAVKEVNDLLAKSPRTSRQRLYGTQEGPQINSAVGIYPTRNWTMGEFEGVEKLSQPYLRETFPTKDTGCPVCSIHCTHVETITSGPYAGASAAPEYETLYALGGNCGIDKPEPIVFMDMLCDDLGLDTMSAGATIAFAMECYEKGLINHQQLGDLDLRFGNDESAVRAIRMIARREGFGDLLAEGSMRLAQRVGHGSERFAMHAKGLEFGGYDPRGAKGQGLVYAIGNRGGCHHAMGLTAATEVQGNRYDIQGKAGLVVKKALERIGFDSAVLCTFAVNPLNLDVMGRLLTAVVGEPYDADRLNRTGMRISTLERAFNAQSGLARKDDILPLRLHEESLLNGVAQGKVLPKEELETMKDDYYRLMSWDLVSGIPTASCLQSLGMSEVATRLSQLGKLS